MKKQTLLCLTLTLLGMMLLCSLAIYLKASDPSDELLAHTQKTQSEADAVIETLQRSVQQADEARTQETETESSDSPLFIWVGDSRTVGMERAMKDGDCYIGASGEGYYWFSTEGLPLMKKAILQYPDAPVILNLGVNDHENLDLYLALYRSLFEEYPDTGFYFLSVNPIDPERCSAITNEEITDFNEHMKTLFPDTYIDSYTWMMANAVETIDGIHYSEEDYRALHDFTLSQLALMEEK